MFDLFFNTMNWVSGQVSTVTTWINGLSGGNDFLAAAMFAALGGALTYVSYIFTKGIPGFFKRRFLVSLTVDQDGENVFVYNVLEDMLVKKVGRFSSRSFFPRYGRFNKGERSFLGLVLLPGLGNHWFFHNKRLFWYIISDLESSGSEKQKKRLSLFTFGMDYQILEDFLKDHGKEVETGFIGVHTHDHNGNPIHITSARFPVLSDLAVNPDVHEYFSNLAENFNENVKHANENKTNYRVISTIHGEPGSGKTALICSMARELGSTDVFLINLENLKDGEALRKLVMQNTSFDGPSIFIIEDMHSFDPILKKEYRDDDVNIGENNLNLSHVLNVFNGVIPLHNTIIFMTTNYVERIDSALLRPSRCTSVIELPRIKPDVANKWIGERVDNWTNMIDREIRGCDLDQIVTGTGFELDLVERNATNVLSKIPEKTEYVYDDVNKVVFD